MNEEKFLQAIDQAIIRAANKMDLSDLEDETDEEYDRTFEDRFHCGTCVVREVLDVVWPEIEAYIDYIKNDTSG